MISNAFYSCVMCYAHESQCGLPIRIETLHVKWRRKCSFRMWRKLEGDWWIDIWIYDSYSWQLSANQKRILSFEWIKSTAKLKLSNEFEFEIGSINFKVFEWNCALLWTILRILRNHGFIHLKLKRNEVIGASYFDCKCESYAQVHAHVHHWRNCYSSCCYVSSLTLTRPEFRVYICWRFAFYLFMCSVYTCFCVRTMNMQTKKVVAQIEILKFGGHSRKIQLMINQHWRCVYIDWTIEWTIDIWILKAHDWKHQFVAK